jgi:hypothetical protein
MQKGHEIISDARTLRILTTTSEAGIIQDEHSMRSPSCRALPRYVDRRGACTAKLLGGIKREKQTGWSKVPPVGLASGHHNQEGREEGGTQGMLRRGLLQVEGGYEHSA